MIAGLIDRYCADPSPEALAVLADAWLEAGDPRGDLVVARTRREIEAALEPVVDRLLARIGRPRRMRIEHGFVVELELSVEDAAKLDAEFPEDEPLATLVLSDLGGGELAAPAGLFGLAFEGTTESWQPLAALVDRVEPRFLRPGPWTPESRFEHVEALSLGVANTAAVAAWVEACPALVALEVSGDAPLPPALWRHPTLAHLDLRDRELSAADRAALDDWLGDGARSVRHPGYTLAPPPGLDWFGDGGHGWPRIEDVRRGAMDPGGDLDYAIASGEAVRIYAGDEPAGAVERGFVTAIDRDGEWVVCGTDAGRVFAVRAGPALETVEPLETVGGPVRRVAIRGADRLVIWDGGWSAVIAGESRGGDEPVSDGALAGGEPVLARGSQLRRGGDRVWDLGAEIVAVAAEGERLVAIAGTRVWQIDGDGAPVLVGRRELLGRPAVAIAGDTLAWIGSPGAVHIRRGDELTMCVYPGTYQRGSFDSDVLRVADLACDRAGAVLAVLEHGGANLLLPGRALKVDPCAGEPDGSWLFVYEGEILIA